MKDEARASAGRDGPLYAGHVVDPGFLKVIGIVADLLGLTEHVHAVLPLDRVRMTRRHRRVETLFQRFAKALDDARTALRVIATGVQHGLGRVGSADRGQDGEAIGFGLPEAESALYRSGWDELLIAVRRMTQASLELEAVTAGMPEEAQRYHRISGAGRSVLEKLWAGRAGRPRTPCDRFAAGGRALPGGRLRDACPGPSMARGVSGDLICHAVWAFWVTEVQSGTASPMSSGRR